VSGGQPPTTATVERVLPAPPAEMYDAWLDEVALREFMCPDPCLSTEVEVDPKPGGRFRIVMSFTDRRQEIVGEYIALDRPDRISFTWRHAEVPDSVVTITFAPHGSDETLMTITHSRLPVELVQSHTGGWGSISEKLAARLGGRAVQP
jgi:uncharacterized protein YndB with AHSA1/START domain